MKTKSTIFTLTSIAYIVPTMILGMLWHFLLFKDLYESLAIYNRAEPIIPLGFASMVIQGVVLAYLYPMYAKGKSTIKTAVVFYMIMGLFLFSVSTLANAAKINVTSMQSWLLVQFGFHIVQFSVAGILVGFVNRQKVL